MPTAVPLPEMVNLALGTPEVGAVNFNVLHTLLHAMIKKLGLGNVKADLNERDHEFLSSGNQGLITSFKPNRLSVVSDKDSPKGHEPTSDDESSRKSPKPGSKDKDGSKEKDTSRDKDGTRYLKDGTRDQKDGTRDQKDGTRDQKDGSRDQKDGPRDNKDGSRDHKDGSRDHHKEGSHQTPYHRLENRVAELAKALADLNSLPSTTEFISQQQSSQPSVRVPDMWQGMQMKKRVDANEEGIGKLMMMMEDLMKEIANLKQENKLLKESVAALQGGPSMPSDVDERLKGLEEYLGDLAVLREEWPNLVRWSDLEDGLKGLREQMDKLREMSLQDDSTKEPAREPVREPAKESVRKETSKEPSRKETKEPRKETPKEPRKETPKEPAKKETPKEPARKETKEPSKEPAEQIIPVVKETRPSIVPQADEEPERAPSVVPLSRPASSKQLSSRPSSGTSLSRVPSASIVLSRPISATSIHGPSESLLDMLETIGKLDRRLIVVEEKVEILEEKKMDRFSPDGVDLYDLLCRLKDDYDALQSLLNQGPQRPGSGTALGLSQSESVNDGQSWLKEKDLKGFDRCVLSAFEQLQDHETVQKLQSLVRDLEDKVDRIARSNDYLTEDAAKKDKRMKKILDWCDSLERNKADKEFVVMEVDVKADKTQLDGKVSHIVFDDTTAEINKTMKELLGQLTGNTDEWKNMIAKLMSDIDGKLDRLELNPLKDWLEKKLKTLSKRINDGSLWSDDEAAGLKRQLIQHYHCLSCDKAVNLVPTGLQTSPVNMGGIPPQQSPRPYTTYEMAQIRQHAKGEGGDMLWNLYREGSGIRSPNNNAPVDYYAQTRQCGGPHTSSMPHQRFNRNFSHLLCEDDAEAVHMTRHNEVDVLGADGHIYRGRVERLEAKIPVRMSASATDDKQNNAQVTPPVMQRPMSARVSSGAILSQPQQQQRPMSSGRTSRPHSARPSKRHDDQHLISMARQKGDGEDADIPMDIPVEVPITASRYAWV